MFSRIKSAWLRRAAEAALYVLLLAAIVIGVDLYRSADVQKDVKLNSSSMRTLTGEPIDIIEMSRKEPVLLYFWATWCPYCSVVSPMVSSLADEHAVVSVAFSSGPDAQVKDYLSEHDYRFVTVNDETGILAKRWGVSVTPTIVIVRDGVVQSVTTGLTTSPGMRARLMLAR